MNTVNMMVAIAEGVLLRVALAGIFIAVVFNLWGTGVQGGRQGILQIA
jgi:hypothetical protein